MHYAVFLQYQPQVAHANAASLAVSLAPALAQYMKAATVAMLDTVETVCPVPFGSRQTLTLWLPIYQQRQRDSALDRLTYVSFTFTHSTMHCADHDILYIIFFFKFPFLPVVKPCLFPGGQ